MHGGVKVYRGAAVAARNYLDADRSRADDYYLAEGTGVARWFVDDPNSPRDVNAIEITYAKISTTLSGGLRVYFCREWPPTTAAVDRRGT